MTSVDGATETMATYRRKEREHVAAIRFSWPRKCAWFGARAARMCGRRLRDAWWRYAGVLNASDSRSQILANPAPVALKLSFSGRTTNLSEVARMWLPESARVSSKDCAFWRGPQRQCWCF